MRGPRRVPLATLVRQFTVSSTDNAFAVLGFDGGFVESAHFVFDLRSGTAGHDEPAGTSWRINLRIASGSCSPAASAKVYDRSKPFGPSTRISQFSLARDPAMDTRHSPGFS